MNPIPQNQFTIFNFNGIQIRAIDRNGDPWFVAADLCQGLEIGNPTQAIEELDPDYKTTIDRMTLSNREGHSTTRGGAQTYNIVSEAGMFSLIFKSRKPSAKAFCRWVTSEVLPAIRKTGSYSRNGGTVSDAQFSILMASLEQNRKVQEQSLQVQEQMRDLQLDMNGEKIDNDSALVRKVERQGMHIVRLEGEIKVLKAMVVRQHGDPVHQPQPRLLAPQTRKPDTEDAFWLLLEEQLRAGRIVAVRRFGQIDKNGRLHGASPKKRSGDEELGFFCPWDPIDFRLRTLSLQEPLRIQPRIDGSNRTMVTGPNKVRRRIAGCIVFRRADVPEDLRERFLIEPGSGTE